jgi:nucleotide-binding universal stress UspA family protein
MARSIVVGVDQSDTAAAAARTAATLARSLGLELVVVTGYGKHGFEAYDDGPTKVYIPTEKVAAAIADGVIDKLRQDYPEVTMTSVAASGKPGQALVTVAERHDAQMIVVGNKRVQGVRRVFGSIAHDVASHAPCDVYIAHTH